MMTKIASHTYSVRPSHVYSNNVQFVTLEETEDEEKEQV